VAGRSRPARRPNPLVLFSPPASPLSEPIEVVPEEQTQAAAIQRALETRVSGTAKKVPLDQVVRPWARAAGINIVFDAKDLRDAALSPQIPVSITANYVTLRVALKQLLGPLDLQWEIRNETLMITTRESDCGLWRIRVYQVRDLVVLRDSQGEYCDPNPLEELLQSAIAPSSWELVGGPGRGITGFAAGGARGARSRIPQENQTARAVGTTSACKHGRRQLK
jgi:hypothetical protein